MNARDLQAEVVALGGDDLAACYFCQKCSSGCPTAPEMDYRPAQVLRMVQLGLRDELLSSRAIWLCIGCETCGTRCPNGISAASVMDALKRMAVLDGRLVAEPWALAFHRSFIDSIRLLGRVHEVSMLAEYKLRSRDLLSDLGLGLQMFLRGKLKFLPSRVERRREVADTLRQEGRK